MDIATYGYENSFRQCFLSFLLIFKVLQVDGFRFDLMGHLMKRTMVCLAFLSHTCFLLQTYLFFVTELCLNIHSRSRIIKMAAEELDEGM